MDFFTCRTIYKHLRYSYGKIRLMEKNVNSIEKETVSWALRDIYDTLDIVSRHITFSRFNIWSNVTFDGEREELSSIIDGICCDDANCKDAYPTIEINFAYLSDDRVDVIRRKSLEIFSKLKSQWQRMYQVYKNFDRNVSSWYKMFVPPSTDLLAQIN